MAEPDTPWTIVVHGGARTIPTELAAAHRQGCRLAAEAGAEVLRFGGTAVAAALTAMRQLEDDPTFNAGLGSVANSDGDVEMDAAIMDGAALQIGAVAAVRLLKNPIEVAAAMLDEPPILLVGEGAERFAQDRGFALLASPQEPSRSGEGHDTVGCVALDVHGHVIAATSTGGLAGAQAGRVGDSPMPGCGFYADDRLGAVSLSGDGEQIARVLAASQIMRGLEHGDAAGAAERLASTMLRVGGDAGAIVVDSAGGTGVAHTSDHFAVAAVLHRLALRTALHRDEMQEWRQDV